MPPGKRSQRKHVRRDLAETIHRVANRRMTDEIHKQCLVFIDRTERLRNVMNKLTSEWEFVENEFVQRMIARSPVRLIMTLAKQIDFRSDV